MRQRLIWSQRSPRWTRRRAACNVRALVLLAALAAGPAAQAVAPPRPDSPAVLPRALRDWPAERPGMLAPSSAPRPAAKSGTALHRLPVLPGAFADRAGTTGVSALQTQWTGGAGKTSVRDYWLTTSGGRLEVVGEVQSWRTAPQTAVYYAGDSNGMDLWAAPRNAGRFVLDIVAAFDAAGFDWGRFDNDGPDGVPNSGDDDGYVDAVVVMHAGRGGECGTADLWSHAFFLAGWGYGAYQTATPRTGGGFIKVNDYVLVPERSCTSGVIEIGVICHEYGHVLGLPDLYDTVGGRAGIGGWGLMGTGGWGGDGHSPHQPTLPGAWSRGELGWCAIETVRQDGTVLLPAVDVQDRALLVRDPAMPAGEHFLVENRLRRGLDATLPAGGLLIWHVDGAVIAATRPMNQVNAGAVLGVALEQADGLEHLTRVLGGNLGDAGDPWPGSSGKTFFAEDSQPRSRDNAGAKTQVALSELPPAGDLASFTVAIGVPWLDTTPPQIAVTAPAAGDALTLGMHHTVRWAASDDVGVTAIDLHLSRDGGASFPVLLAGGLADTGAWTGSLGSVPGEQLVVRARARDAAGNLGEGQSGTFALRDKFPPAVTLTTDLTAGDLLDPGAAVHVAWQSADNVGVVTVELQLGCDGGQSWQLTAHSGLAPSGSAVWIVPAQPCPDARLRAVARDAAGNEGHDTSPPFAIRSALTDVPDLAGRLRLGPCIPNPFNPRADIVYHLPAAGSVRLTIHDAAGRRVRTLVADHRTAGRHVAVWDGRNEHGRETASGSYWVRASGPGGRALLKVTLVR